jgi:AraC family transcriptional regulator
MRHLKEIQTLKSEAAAALRNAIALSCPITGVPPLPAHRVGTMEAYTVAVERAIGHMKAHLAEPLDLDCLARVAGISKFHLERVFNELTGTTPHHFLACLRMQRAKDLLLTPKPSITEVCLEAGYTSLGTFSTTFSNLVGLPPQEFRAMTKRLTARQFAVAIRRFLTGGRKVSGPQLAGMVECPPKPRGFIFVGTFSHGVPQGAPFSGTVMLKPGIFCIERPMIPEFHLLAVLIPFTAKWSAFAANLPVALVAGGRVQNRDPAKTFHPVLRLRPVRPTDPPIVLALPPLLQLTPTQLRKSG